MSANNQPPNLAVFVSNTNKRLDALERKLNDAFGQFKPEIIFSYSGLVAAEASPPATVGVAERAYVIVGLLGVAGSTDTVVEFQKNGVTEATVTLQADQRMAQTPVSVRCSPDQDVLRFVTTTAGAGAEDLTVIARFKPAQ